MSRFHTHEWDFLPTNAFRPRGGKGAPMTLEGGKGGSSAPPPDPRLVEAQIRSMGIQDRSIEEIMANSRELMPIQREQMKFGLDTSRTAWEQSQADRGYSLERRGALTTLQDRAISDANTFDTEAKGEQYADMATADVGMQAEIARQSQTRGLQRMGVNPSSGRMLAINSQLGLSEAAAKAGAANKVREAARLEGYNLNDRASNALAGYPAMGMSATGSGAGFGANGLSLANSGLAGMNSGWGAAATGAGQMGSNATGMFNAQANYKNQQDQIAAQNDPFNTILGAAAGAATSYGMGFLPKPSDRRLKTDIEVVGVLDNGLAVYKYRYKSGGPMELGVMADEVAQMVPQAYIQGGAGNGFDAVDYSKL